MMISKKIHYSEKLLQLVLALSLLRVDPTNYIDLGWETRELSGEGGWQLEITSLSPLSTYTSTYINRKDSIPLISDLYRFDRYYNDHHDLQTYLLNVSDNNNTVFSSNPNNGTSNATTPANTSHTNNERNLNSHLSSRTEDGSSLTMNLVNLFQDHQTSNTNINRSNNDVDDLFMNSEMFTNSESIFDQNLADLNDYEDLFATPQQYLFPLPTKTEVPDYFEDLVAFQQQPPSPFQQINDIREIEIKKEETDNDSESEIVNVMQTSAGEATNSSADHNSTRTVTIHSRIINWNDYHSNSTKEEKTSEDSDGVLLAIKKEEDDSTEKSSDNEFVSSVELTREVCTEFVRLNSFYFS